MPVALCKGSASDIGGLHQASVAHVSLVQQQCIRQGRKESLEIVRETSGVNKTEGNSEEKAFTWADWCNIESGAASSSATAIADEKDTTSSPLEVMKRLQESFDATTRLSLECGRTAQTLTSLNNDGRRSQNVREMIQKGLALLKELAGPSQRIQEMLCELPEHIDPTEAKTILKAAASPFQKLEHHHQERFPFIKLLKEEQKKKDGGQKNDEDAGKKDDEAGGPKKKQRKGR